MLSGEFKKEEKEEEIKREHTEDTLFVHIQKNSV